ncbi:MAG: homocysteine S-methyltransferase family protein [Pseudomonadota bacterium]
MTRYEKLLHRMRNGEQIMIDGGTGTEVERRGVPQLENAWNGGGALSHPDIVRGIHEDYIRHGAQIVISNTFATSRNLLEDAGVPELFEAYNRRGVELACEARKNMGNPNVLVAGGISHWTFTGRLPSLEELTSGATEQAKIMADAGADLIMLEMMVEVPRMLAVLEGARSSGLPVWVGFSCAPDAEGNICLQAGETDETGKVYGGSNKLLKDAIAALDGKDIPLISIMHTDVRDINACLDVVEEHWNGLVGVYAHSGEFIDNTWIFEGTISPEDFTSAAQTWLDRDTNLVGGCCGIRPDHMAALSDIV